jgi:hypothetical protein
LVSAEVGIVVQIADLKRGPSVPDEFSQRPEVFNGDDVPEPLDV